MKVLVVDGTTHNLGDIAMLESVALHLLEWLPDAELHIIDHPGLHSELWGWERVRRVCPPVRRDYLYSRYLDRIPMLRGLRALTRTVWTLYRHALCGRTARRRSVSRSCSAWSDQFDAVHIAGGGSLTDSFPGIHWERCSLLQAFAAQGKPIVLTGQQVGPFRHAVTRDCLKRALRQVAFLGLRDSGDSYENCRRGLLDPAQFAVMGDDSFGLPAASVEEAGRLLGRYGLRPGRFLAINVRLANYSDLGAAHLDRIAAFVRALTEQSALPALVVPIAMNRGGESSGYGFRLAADSDVVSGHELRKLLPEVVQVLDVPDLRAKQAKAVLAAAHGAVGVSHHFCTFALSEGVPAICLHRGSYYGHKASGLAAFWRDSRLALPLDGMDPLAAAKQVLNVFEDQALRAALVQRAACAKAEWLRIFRERVGAAYGRKGAGNLTSPGEKQGLRQSS